MNNFHRLKFSDILGCIGDLVFGKKVNKYQKGHYRNK